MNIQIFGKSKCFDTKKAERWFKERRVKYQSIDIIKYGLSAGELRTVKQALGGIDALVDWEANDSDIDLMRYLAGEAAKEDKLAENPRLFITPIVRNGKKATVGYCPDVWEKWLSE